MFSDYFSVLKWDGLSRHARALYLLLAIHLCHPLLLSTIMAAVEIPRGDVCASINFLKPLGPDDDPYYIYIRCAPPEGIPPMNLRIEPHRTTIHDLRGHEQTVNLDQDSIKLLASAAIPPEVDFGSDESIKHAYYPAVEKHLRAAIPDATQIRIFRHAVRHTGAPKQYAPAALFAHVDQTGPAVADRVRRHLGTEASSLLQGRFRLIHFWQVINGPVQTMPLAFASAATVSDADLAPVVSHLADFSEDFGAPRFNESQKWYYWSGVDPGEAIVMQLFDSAAADPASGVRGGRAIHSAFKDPRTPENALPRFSIETSALVFGP